MYKASLGWKNGNMVPFSKSYVDKLKNSPELSIFIYQIQEAINHGYSPPENLITLEEFVKFLQNYSNPKTNKRIKDHLLSKTDREKIEIMSRSPFPFQMSSKEWDVWNKELKYALDIQDPKKRLEHLYRYLLRDDTVRQYFSSLLFPIGREIEGDILTEKCKILQQEVRDLSSDFSSSDAMILMIDPSFKSYELELEMDTLELLSKFTNKSISEGDILTIIRQRLEELSEDLFIYAGKHFDGSVNRTLQKFIEVRDINPGDLLMNHKKRISHRKKLYSQTLKRVLDVFGEQEGRKANFLRNLDDIHKLFYLDKYVGVKGLVIIQRPNFTGYVAMETVNHIIETIKEINPNLTKNDLNNFEKIEEQVKSISGFNESLEYEIVSGTLKNIEKGLYDQINM